MRKLFLMILGVAIAGLALAQEPDSTNTKMDTVVTENKVESPALYVPESPEEGPELQEQPVENEERSSSEPKIIYYQSEPEPRYETRYRSRFRDSRNDIKTLAGSMNHSGGFGAISFRTTDYRDETMIMAGLRGGWIINRTVGIGLEGHGIIPTTKYEDIDPRDDVFALGGYGGMFLELIFFSNTVVHVTFPTSAGAGWLGYVLEYDETFSGPNYSTTSSQTDVLDEDVFWYVEPGANIEVNISRNFRMCFGVSKRFTQDLQLETTSAKEFENMNYYLTLKVGGF
jgi:hypothetical protein